MTLAQALLWILVVLSAWFALALAVVGVWNVVKGWVRRRAFRAYLTELEHERWQP